MKHFVVYHDEPDYVSDHFARVDFILEAPDRATAERFVKYATPFYSLAEVPTYTAVSGTPKEIRDHYHAEIWDKSPNNPKNTGAP